MQRALKHSLDDPTTAFRFPRFRGPIRENEMNLVWHFLVSVPSYLRPFLIYLSYVPNLYNLMCHLQWGPTSIWLVGK